MRVSCTADRHLETDMDELATVAILGLGLGFIAFVLPIILYFRVSELKRRVATLERALAPGLDLRAAAQTVSGLADESEDGFLSAAPEDKTPADSVGGSLASAAAETADLPQPDADAPVSGPFAHLPRRDSSPQAKPVEPSTKPAIDREREIGGKWTVWAGGIALAIGGVFLVKYAIDNNLFGPEVRILLGAVLGLGLMAAGEFTRRRPDVFAVPGFETANIPATLTAAGSLTLFADLYAAHALYGLIGPALAFVALGAVAVLTMLAALLHGPALAGLGVAASYAVPLLVTSREPALVPAMTYILFVSAAAIGIGRARFWLWLAGLAVAGLCAYGFLFGFAAGQGDRLALVLYLLAATLLVLAGFVFRLHRNAPAVPVAVDWVATAALSAVLLPLVLTLQFPSGLGFSLLEAGLLLVPFVLASHAPALRYAVFGPLVVLLLLAFGFGEGLMLDDLTRLTLTGDAAAVITPVPAEAVAQLATFRLLLGIEGLFLFALAFYASLRSAARGLVTAAALAGVVGLVGIAWIRLEDWQVSVRFGLLALALALLCLAMAEHFTARFGRRQSSQAAPFVPGGEAALAGWVIAGLTSAVLSACFSLGSAALTVALGLLPLIVAATGLRHRLVALRWLVPLSVLPYAARLLWDPFIVGDQLGATPLFNALLPGYGLPALGLAGAAVLLSFRSRDLPALGAQALAILFGVLALAMLALHSVDPVFRFSGNGMELQASAVLVLIGCAVALGLTRLGRNTVSPVLTWGAMAVSLAGMGFGALTLSALVNPLMTGEPVGMGHVFNWVTYAYGLPAVLYTVLALAAAPVRPRRYVQATMLFAALLGFWFVNLTIRQAFSPDYLDAAPISELETYVTSLVWLVIGVGLLGFGFLRASLGLRKLSGVVIAAVVLKVFLIDMSSLEGVMRALSFVGLGLTLMGIGVAYQRLVLRLPAPLPAADDTARP
ncbi:DUF2339 domain-containing protein [Pannonibacter sp.]|uniref:DUF2339 domain-containing protein n=1 Tax=Pannonibacter sp. TaxID=1906786 RepID=UPI003F6FD273